MAEDRCILQIHNKSFTLNTDQLQGDYFYVIFFIFSDKQFKKKKKKLRTTTHVLYFQGKCTGRCVRYYLDKATRSFAAIIRYVQNDHVVKSNEKQHLILHLIHGRTISIFTLSTSLRLFTNYLRRVIQNLYSTTSNENIIAGFLNLGHYMILTYKRLEAFF